MSKWVRIMDYKPDKNSLSSLKLLLSVKKYFFLLYKIAKMSSIILTKKVQK
jgi:hypothetical protein